MDSVFSLLLLKNRNTVDEGYSVNVVEAADDEADNSDMEWIKAAANSSKAVIRLRGDSKHEDIEISYADKIGYRKMLNAYNAAKTYYSFKE